MKNTHWKVVTQEGGQWPAIQATTADAPFVVFPDATAIGQRGALKWADLLCRWMNEQMRLGNTANRPRQCDPMLVAKVRAMEAEMRKLNRENHDLCSKLVKARSACASAESALRRGLRE
jgi:hypothetical protein